VQQFAVVAGSAPHDVAPAADGGVWYTGQRNGTLGHLDPRTGTVREVRLGAGSSPHGVIVDPGSGIAWVTDSGLNAMVSVDPRANDAVKVYRLPAGTPNVNLNTATIDRRGLVWFTGQNGWYGSLDPGTGEVRVQQAPRGRGPYGIATTPGGDVYYASLAGNHIARVDTATGAATPIDPPTQRQGARRVWSDSTGKIWVSEYNAGQVARYDPASGAWKEWRLPGQAPLAYSVYVDDRDAVWLTDFSAHAVVRFDPSTEQFTSFPHQPGGNVRQMLGRPGEVWGGLSALDRLIVIRTR
jgi:virginiamycin B lyase